MKKLLYQLQFAKLFVNLREVGRVGFSSSRYIQLKNPGEKTPGFFSPDRMNTGI
jgi:hypothetical protein